MRGGLRKTAAGEGWGDVAGTDVAETDVGTTGVTGV